MDRMQRLSTVRIWLAVTAFAPGDHRERVVLGRGEEVAQRPPDLCRRPSNPVSFAHHFRRHGYATVSIGKVSHEPAGTMPPEYETHQFPLELTGYYYWPSGPGNVSREEAIQQRRAYCASVAYVDIQIGKVLDELGKLDCAGETIVVLWSDHGWQLGEHHIFSNHSNYEGEVGLVELYDRENDPAENFNVARPRTNIVEELTQKLSFKVNQVVRSSHAN